MYPKCGNLCGQRGRKRFIASWGPRMSHICPCIPCPSPQGYRSKVESRHFAHHWCTRNLCYQVKPRGGADTFLFYVTDGNIMYLTDASRSLISCVIQHYAPVVGCGGGRNRCILLIMTLEPSLRQTLRLPSPGIEPGSPASQTGTLPEELSRQLTPVLRIRDFYPRSRILIFSYLRSWIQNSNKREG
jgi:hypothetical protein